MSWTTLKLPFRVVLSRIKHFAFASRHCDQLSRHARMGKNYPFLLKINSPDNGKPLSAPGA
jgi:hypothetical protein